MKKKLYLIILCFLLTGCSATYDMEIKQNGVIEENLKINSTEFDNDQINVFIDNPITFSKNNPCILDYDEVINGKEKEKEQENINYYKIEYNKKNTLKFNASSVIGQYQNSRIANSLYNNLNVNINDEYISIYGYNDIFAFYNYPKLQNITVNIKVKNKVKEHNADDVNKNVYTWYYNKNTNLSKTLYIEFSREKENKEQLETNSKISSGYIIIGIFVILLVVLIILKIKEKKEK